MTDPRDYPYQMMYEPSYWREMAASLKLAAETVMREVDAAREQHWQQWQARDNGQPASREDELSVSGRIDMFRPAQMLQAFALENAFKGLIAHGGCEPPTTGNEAHNLIGLAAAANFALDAKETKLLKYLTDMGQLGRYRVAGNEKRGYKFGAALIDEFLQPLDGIWQRVEERFALPGFTLYR